MSSKYVYTDEMEARMHDVFANGIDEDKIQSLVDEFEFPRRSVTAKARKLGFTVPKKAGEPPKFDEEETANLVELLNDNKGELTAENIAAQFEDGKFNARQITGKALSLEMTGHIKPAVKKVTPKTYTDDEEVTIRQMVGDNAFLEEIADALGKAVNSVRGKLLSMELKAPQKNKKDTKKDAYEGIEAMAVDNTVAELAEHFSKTERGVKTVLARRRVKAKDYSPKTIED